MRVLSVGLLTCLSIGCVSQATADEPKQASPAATQPVQAPAAATASSTTASKATDAALDKSLRARGYKVEVKNGTTYYCRRELVVGSHFESKVCSTSEQLHSTQQDTQDSVDKMQREGRGTICSGANC
jgi:hypothetical protein